MPPPPTSKQHSSNGPIVWLTLSSNQGMSCTRELMLLAHQQGYRAGLIETEIGNAHAPILQAMDNAAGFVLETPDVVGVPEFRDALIAAVRKGKRLLVTTRSSEFNDLLIEFDLAVTTKKLWHPSGAFGDERVALVHNPARRTVAMTEKLLHGSRWTTVQLPMRVWYGGSSAPFLVADDDAALIDALTDIVVPTTPREMCCGGYWPVKQDGPSGVLLIAGGVFGDPYITVGGDVFAGIRANVNLAVPVLQWLAGDQVLHTGPRDLIEAIELSLYDIVESRMRKEYGQDWTSRGLPEKVQANIAKRGSSGQLPAEARLFLIELLIAIETNWHLFATTLEQSAANKPDLAWLRRCNDIRNRLAHPKRLQHEPISADELRLLEERHQWLLEKVDKPRWQ